MSVLSSLVLAILAQGTGTETTIGRKIDDFRLQDFRGAMHALADIPGDQLVVVAFLGTECPLAKMYAPRLNALAKEFESQGVRFLAVMSNRQDTIAKIEHFARQQQISFPVLKDAGNAIADRFAAERTPEVFVLGKDRKVRYHGRVDDQFGVGYLRPAATRADLKEALHELLEGKEVSVAQTNAPGCFIGRVRPVDENAEVTYSKQISRIFQSRCVECHRAGQIAPFALTSHEESAGWAETIVEVVRDRRMPPWHADPRHGDFVNDATLTEEEKNLLTAWAAAGAPEGDPKDLPEPLTFAEGWRIPKPDLVLEMKDEFHVPATGEVRYQYFVLDPKLTEDKWIIAAECVAGNPAVVHHNIAFVVPPDVAKEMREGYFRGPGQGNTGRGFTGNRGDGERDLGGNRGEGPRRFRGNFEGRRSNARNDADVVRDGRGPRDQREGGERTEAGRRDFSRRPVGAAIPGDISNRIGIMRSWFTNYLVAMAPGTPPMILGDGKAKRIEAGSKIVFQMHYTPIGIPQTDRSKIGLVFADPSNVKREVVTRSVMEQRFEIPPYDPNYQVKGSVRFREDTYMLELFPHMHLRGKSFKYTAKYPDGREEILLDVPGYDFAWQNIYTFREPKLLPRGTVLECVAHFDNSEENLSNPDPSRTVRFGDQTWEEMMIGFFNMALAREGAYLDPEKTRTELCLEKMKAMETVISDELRERAANAFNGDEDFDRFWDLVAERYPQVDRMDIGVADGFQFRWAFVSQGLEIPSAMKMKELPRQINGAVGPLLGLYQYATKKETTVNDGSTPPTGVEMQILGRILPSSVHIPLRVQGKPASVNFWSIDKNAFPPEVVASLEEIVDLLKSDKTTASIKQ